jgi:hypothetical protein
MVVKPYIPNIGGTEAREIRTLNQFGLHMKTLSQNRQKDRQVDYR